MKGTQLKSCLPVATGESELNRRSLPSPSAAKQWAIRLPSHDRKNNLLIPSVPKQKPDCKTEVLLQKPTIPHAECHPPVFPPREKHLLQKIGNVSLDQNKCVVLREPIYHNSDGLCKEEDRQNVPHQVLQGCRFKKLGSPLSHILNWTSFPDMELTAVSFDEEGKVESHSVAVHSLILSMVSPTLREAFSNVASLDSGGGAADATFSVIIPEADRALLRNLTEFIYRGVAYGARECCVQLRDMLRELRIVGGGGSVGDGGGSGDGDDERSDAELLPCSGDFSSPLIVGDQPRVVVKSRQRSLSGIGSISANRQLSAKQVPETSANVNQINRTSQPLASVSAVNNLSEDDLGVNFDKNLERTLAVVFEVSKPSLERNATSAKKSPAKSKAITVKNSKKVAQQAGSKYFKCDLCTESWASQKLLDIHRATHRCPLCPFSCSGNISGAMQKHFDERHPNNTWSVKDSDFKPRPCEFCFETFTNAVALTTHLSVEHHKKKSYPCKYCSRVCSSPRNYQYHVKSLHERSDADEFKCPLCEFSTLHRKRLLVHMKLKHLDEVRRKHLENVKRVPETDMPPHQANKEPFITAKTISLQDFLAGNLPADNPGLQETAANRGPTITHSSDKLETIHASDEFLDLATIESVEIPSKVRVKCPLCGLMLNRKSLRFHTLRVHDKVRNFMCDQCPKRTFTVQGLRKHQRTHSDEKPHPCSECGTRFNLQSNLQRHMSQHTGERRFACADCPYKATQLDCLKAHVLHHTGEFPFTCSLCTFGGKTLFSVKKHSVFHLPESERKTSLLSRAKSNRQASTKCTQCPFIAQSKLHLQKHTRFHSGERKFKCHLCNYSVTRAGFLNWHLDLHAGIRRKRKTRNEPFVIEGDKKMFKCDLCTYSTAYFQGLESHRRTHTGEKPFTCEHCSKSFTQHVHLRRHMLQHTGEKPFRCSRCSYAATSRGNLRQHMFKHCDEKPFQCKFCAYTTGDKRSFKLHIFRHTGKYPFNCQLCSFACIGQKEFVRHQQIHAGEKLTFQMHTGEKLIIEHTSDKRQMSPQGLVKQPHMGDVVSYQTHMGERLINQTHTGEKRIDQTHMGEKLLPDDPDQIVLSADEFETVTTGMPFVSDDNVIMFVEVTS